MSDEGIVVDGQEYADRDEARRLGAITHDAPPMSAFYLEADCQDSTVWLQCARCLETWKVITLHDAVQEWNEHTCVPREKTLAEQPNEQ